jgi:hypothetical protein
MDAAYLEAYVRARQLARYGISLIWWVWYSMIRTSGPVDGPNCLLLKGQKYVKIDFTTTHTCNVDFEGYFKNNHILR